MTDWLIGIAGIGLPLAALIALQAVTAGWKKAAIAVPVAVVAFPVLVVGSLFVPLVMYGVIVGGASLGLFHWTRGKLAR